MTRLLAPAVAAALVFAACKTPSVVHPLALEHNAYGTRYLEEGNLDKAQHRFELALEYNQDYPDPYNNLCLVWIKRGNLDKAKDFCIKALRLNNDFAEAHNNLGYIYLQQKSYGKAHDAFKAALRVNPGYVEARYNLCLTLLRLERGKDARVCYDKIIETNSAIADPYHDLCVLDVQEKQLDSAVQNCNRALELDPKFVDAWFHLGKAQQQAGQSCEAQEAYKSCLSIDEANAECRTNLVAAANQCALMSPHLQDVRDQAISENSPASLYKLGLAERERGLRNDAERHFKKCLRLDGRFGPCHCQLAQLHAEVSNRDEARAYCKKCLSYTGEEQAGAERQLCEKLLKD